MRYTKDMFPNCLCNHFGQEIEKRSEETEKVIRAGEEEGSSAGTGDTTATTTSSTEALAERCIWGNREKEQMRSTTCSQNELVPLWPYFL